MWFEIFTFEKENICISFSPERGGIITGINLGGREILYLNEETFYNPEKNVRGGIPLMFPNAGPLDEEKQKECAWQLKQHGFARHSAFSYEIWENRFIMRLTSSQATKMLFSYDFELFLSWMIEKNKIIITQKIKNTWNISLPIACGLHPYFFVPNAQKSQISFSHLQDNFFEIWSLWATKILPNPWVFEVHFPDYTLVCEYDSAFEYIWLWSEPGKDFICIEPVVRNANGLFENPLVLEPWEVKELWISYGII